ncbi:MAG: TerB family tellurite resistance protein [Cyclobacteriaceae bacterium]|nr:TerB family tellurite resistance protein [Cyclobacteriaceae bacterium]
MHGFFEHQYLSYKKNHIRTLLEISRADGLVHEKEREMLFRIGRRYGLKDRQIQNLLDEQATGSITIPEQVEDKINTLYDLVLMIYADGVVEEREIQFAEDLASRFALHTGIVRWLLFEVFDRGNPPGEDQWQEYLDLAKQKFC